MDRLEQVREIITKVLPSVDNSNITRHTTFEDLSPDSLEIVEMVMEAEDAFGITIMEEQAEQLRSVGDLMDLIEAELRKVPQPA
jgi:acyl carrier protein